jgi:hypothetical protein
MRKEWTGYKYDMEKEKEKKDLKGKERKNDSPFSSDRPFL